MPSPSCKNPWIKRAKNRRKPPWEGRYEDRPGELAYEDDDLTLVYGMPNVRGAGPKPSAKT